MASAGKKKYSGQCEEAHPEIYTLAAMPDPRALGKKPGQLSEDKIRQFFEKVRIEFVSNWIFTSGRSNSVISIIHSSKLFSYVNPASCRKTRFVSSLRR